MRAVLPNGQALAIEHAGSTAVPGLAAKPIIDIYVGVKSLSCAKRTFVEPLEGIGYRYWADNPNTREMFFVKGLPPDAERRTHHVHVVEDGSEAWTRPLLFRDYLRHHRDEAERYRTLKLALARQHRHAREDYTNAKGRYVENAIEKARQQLSCR